MCGWLLGHTLTEDQAIAGRGTSKWGELLPEDQQVAMKQIIIKLLSDMFQLKAKVVSDCYGGEKFGDGVYYRLAYATKQGENGILFWRLKKRYFSIRLAV